MKHKWRWSPLCNGRGVCRECGLKARSMRGPKGGQVMGYRVGGKWIREAPPCKRTTK